MRFGQLLCWLLLLPGLLHAQTLAVLKPGFDIDEYLSLVSISSRQDDPLFAGAKRLPRSVVSVPIVRPQWAWTTAGISGYVMIKQA